MNHIDFTDYNLRLVLILKYLPPPPGHIILSTPPESIMAY